MLIRKLWTSSTAMLESAFSIGVTRQKFTSKMLSDAQIAGFENIRMYADASKSEVRASQQMFIPDTGSRRANYLALSAGGDGGAYGAGYLNGWSARGDRPSFDMVTGVSSGAFIAPFAFVGKSADAKLASFFQNGMASQMESRNSLLQGALGQSIYPSGPMIALIKSQVDDSLIDQVGERYRAGARLLVLSTNLDAGRGVIWNLGAVAASDQSARYDLFRNVLRASASIPAFFPPTEIVSQNGDDELIELHVDGGAIRQLFFLPDAALSTTEAQYFLPNEKPNFYVIVNQGLTPDFTMARGQTLAIGRRAYDILIRNSTHENLTADFEFAHVHGIPFQMTHIPASLSELVTCPPRLPHS